MFIDIKSDTILPTMFMLYYTIYTNYDLSADHDTVHQAGFIDNNIMIVIFVTTGNKL